MSWVERSGGWGWMDKRWAGWKRDGRGGREMGGVEEKWWVGLNGGRWVGGAGWRRSGGWD